jgi:gamma-glutamylaminecyclotransferase
VATEAASDEDSIKPVAGRWSTHSAFSGIASVMSSAGTRVFVYGTLLYGEENHRLLARARFIGAARTRPEFELRDFGDYPGLVRGGAQVVVAGEVYEVDAALLAELDRFEEHPELYLRTAIALAGGDTAETYLLRPEQAVGCPVIAGGDWRAHSRLLRARHDSQLTATLRDARPLAFERADVERDLPRHVRAGSAVRRWGQRLVVVQDDVHALALLDENSGAIAPLVLPPGADGRRTFGEALGNKALKLDLEACVVLADGRLVALGSGSTPSRQHLVVVSDDYAVRVVDGSELYAQLRSRIDFAGSELNLEGAVVSSSALCLFQRGNGAPRDGIEPVNAIGDLDCDAFVHWLDGGAVPVLARVRQVDLGTVAGVRFGFTDAAALPDGRIAFVAAAENSPDTFRDGEVAGCRFGIIDGHDIYVTDIRDEGGAPIQLKLEGIDWRGEHADGGWEFAVVADMDTPDTPALLATLRVAHGRR